MIQAKVDYCKKCGAGVPKPWAPYLKRIQGDICGQIGCGGELGTYEEWEQARREAVGIPALEAKIKALEKRVAELEKRAKK